MNIIIDTHALLWLLTNDRKLSNKGRVITRQASQIFIPTIVLLELLYLLQKQGIANEFIPILNTLKSDIKYTIVSLDVGVVEKVVDLSSKLEMHDCIIVATAQTLKLPIVTKDRTMKKMYKETVW